MLVFCIHVQYIVVPVHETPWERARASCQARDSQTDYSFFGHSVAGQAAKSHRRLDGFSIHGCYKLLVRCDLHGDMHAVDI